MSFWITVHKGILIAIRGNWTRAKTNDFSEIAVEKERQGGQPTETWRFCCAAVCCSGVFCRAAILPCSCLSSPFRFVPQSKPVYSPVKGCLRAKMTNPACESGFDPTAGSPPLTPDHNSGSNTRLPAELGPAWHRTCTAVFRAGLQRSALLTFLDNLQTRFWLNSAVAAKGHSMSDVTLVFARLNRASIRRPKASSGETGEPFVCPKTPRTDIAADRAGS